MLRQKEFRAIYAEFEAKGMKGYKKWFNENVNCEIIYAEEHEELYEKEAELWPKKAILLKCSAKNFFVAAVENWGGYTWRFGLNDYSYKLINR